MSKAMSDLENRIARAVFSEMSRKVASLSWSDKMALVSAYQTDTTFDGCTARIQRLFLDLGMSAIKTLKNEHDKT